jgi:hypothetical protein
MIREQIALLRSGKHAPNIRNDIADTMERLLAENEHQQEVIDRVALLRLDLESENIKLKAVVEAARNALTPPFRKGMIAELDKALAALDKDNE